MCFPALFPVVAAGIGPGASIAAFGTTAFAGFAAPTLGASFAVGAGISTSTILSGLSTASSILGTFSQAAAQKQQAQAQRAQAEYQAAVSRNNKIISDRAAADAIERGRIAEQEQRLATSRLRSRQRVVLAGIGQQVDVGSALDITSDTAATGELDALTIRSNAEREALGFTTQGINFEAEAGLSDLRGRSAQSNAFGTIITGAGTVASKWFNFRKEGVPGF